MTDMSGWGRSDQKKNAVAMTEQDARILADMVAEVLRNRTKDDTWDQYRRLIHLESELAKAVEELSRRDALIAALNDQISTLKNILLAVQTQQAPAQWPTPPITWQLPPGGTLSVPQPPPNTTVIYQNPSAGMNYEVPRQTPGE